VIAVDAAFSVATAEMLLACFLGLQKRIDGRGCGRFFVLHYIRGTISVYKVTVYLLSQYKTCEITTHVVCACLQIGLRECFFVLFSGIDR
jgi:hypothetical protein